MKLLFLFYIKILLLCFVSAKVSAQEHFGNEWIGAATSYVRIPVVKTAFYQITRKQLSDAGVFVDSVDCNTFQLFRRGREVAIEIVPGAENQWNAFYFLGEQNDGAADSSLYVSPTAQPHRKYSLYADTAVYFLIWGQKNGKRIVTDMSTANRTTSYLWQESEQIYTSHYATGPFYPENTGFQNGAARTAYDEGEGWTGPAILKNGQTNISSDLPHALPYELWNATAEILLTGRSPGLHQAEIWTKNSHAGKRLLATIALEGYKSVKIPLLLSRTDFINPEKIGLEVRNTGSEGTFSVSYVKVCYGRLNDFEGTQQILFNDPSQSHAFWQHPTAGRTYYDCSNPNALKRLNVSPDGVTLAGAERIILVGKPASIPLLDLRYFPKIHPEHFNFLIITHPALRKPVAGIDPVNGYAAYRASQKGGAFKPLILSVDDIADVFNSGDPGPAGIRKCIAWFQRQNALQFVFLIGQSEDPQHVRKQPDARTRDMVPNAGWPGADWSLVMDAHGTPGVSVGRLNAASGQQVLDYLQKVKALEAEPPHALWRRNVLHLSGGRSRDELVAFRQFMERLTVEIAPVGLQIHNLNKQTTHEAEPAPVQQAVNEGTALLTFFGHSAVDMTDFDIGSAGMPGSGYANCPRYPAVIVNGCASGSIFYSRHALSQNWIFAPKSGAVLFLAHSFNASAHYLARYTALIYEVLADTAFTHQPFGQIIKEAISRGNTRNPDLLDRITAEQMILHGDPAIRIFPDPFSPTPPTAGSADRIPPLLDVLLDKKRLMNGGTAGVRPAFDMVISDDNPMRADTALCSIWVKKQCIDCPWKRIDLSEAVMNKLSENAIRITVTPDEPLLSGKYHLLAEGRDVANNWAKPYEIDFVVAGHPEITAIEVSPNPSGSWFRFLVQAQGVMKNSSIELKIADLQGRLVYQTFLPISNGRNECFWYPPGFGTSTYIYHLELDKSEIRAAPDVGSAMTGRLLQVE